MTDTTHDAILVFTRYPEPGRTKTRLIPALGPQGAADLHGCMALHTIARAEAFAARSGARLGVRTEGGDERSMAQWLGPEVECVPQGEGDLGERMARAFDDSFAAGAKRAVIIGTDCPGLSGTHLAEAMDALDGADLVLGPAADGGYYLIGLRRPAPELFDGIAWGTGDVLERTTAAAARLGLDVRLLDELSDVDRPEDLAVWEAEAAGPQAALAAAPISVVIPALNEADNLPATLECLRGAYNVDVIVVDGDSADGTPDAARAGGAHVIESARGRAAQMNAGAAAATGGILLFLHADTRLPVGFARHVRATLAEPRTAAGAFELAIDAPGRPLRAIEWGANWRARQLGTPYGDQAIFLRAEVFREVGGFPDLPILEDYELVRRLRRRGRIAIVPAPALASARRWARLGPLRTTLLNWAVVLAYHLGVSPDRLARWYRVDASLAGKER